VPDTDHHGKSHTLTSLPPHLVLSLLFNIIVQRYWSILRLFNDPFPTVSAMQNGIVFMYSLLNGTVINSGYSFELWDYKCLLNWEKCERILLWTNFRHGLNICVIVPRKTTKKGIKAVTVRARKGIRVRFPTGARYKYLSYSIPGVHPAISPTGAESPFHRAKILPCEQRCGVWVGGNFRWSRRVGKNVPTPSPTSI
jgi:hypothetical protein